MGANKASISRVWTAGCSSPPPEQALRDAVGKLQAAVQTRDIDALFEPIADDFVGPEGMDRQTFRRYVTVITLRKQKFGVQLGPLDVKMFAERATVTFTAATTGSDGWLPDSAQVYQVETGWRMESGQWKLMSAAWQAKL